MTKKPSKPSTLAKKQAATLLERNLPAKPGHGKDAAVIPVATIKRAINTLRRS